VSTHDQIDDAEAKADAGGLARQALIDAIEPPEDTPLLDGRNTDAVVGDVEADEPAVRARPHADPLVAGGVLQGVLEQVHERCT
jgi:hypothetical protein